MKVFGLLQQCCWSTKSSIVLRLVDC